MGALVVGGKLIELRESLGRFSVGLLLATGQLVTGSLAWERSPNARRTCEEARAGKQRETHVVAGRPALDVSLERKGCLFTRDSLRLRGEPHTHAPASTQPPVHCGTSHVSSARHRVLVEDSLQVILARRKNDQSSMADLRRSDWLSFYRLEICLINHDLCLCLLSPVGERAFFTAALGSRSLYHRPT